MFMFSVHVTYELIYQISGNSQSSSYWKVLLNSATGINFNMKIMYPKIEKCRKSTYTQMK